MFNEAQQRQVNKQVAEYERRQKTTNVIITVGGEQIILEVDPFVAHPDIMNSGVQVIRYIEEHRDIVRGQIVTDMGTGCGIIGIAAAKLGASLVHMPDIDERAVKNANRNIRSLELGDHCQAFRSDLFEAMHLCRPATLQIFNHPFFLSEPLAQKEWTRMMLDDGKLIDRYFDKAPAHSYYSETQFLLPWLTTADNGAEPDNNPAKHALRKGYELVDCAEQSPVEQGLQRGRFQIYLFRRPFPTHLNSLHFPFTPG